jgi:hypothetical protein
MPQLPEKLSFEEVGGEKTDYAAVVDTSTDRSAEEINAAFCAIAETTRTAPRAFVRFTGHATTPVMVAWEAMWKGATSTTPTLSRATTGVYNVTFPSTVDDERGESHSLVLRGAHASLEGGTFGFITATISSNVVTVRLANTAGTANDFAGTTFLLVVY